MYDMEEYRDTLRGFYFDIEKEAPGPIVRTMTELNEALEEFGCMGKYVNSEENYQKFYDKYCYLENGMSTEKFVKNMIVKLDD